jgi:preprotein translocase subunit YajC
MAHPEFSSFFSLAQTAAPSGDLGQFLPIILLFLGMWFLIIAPQRKRQKAHDKMLSELKKGDEIVTSGGLFGTITRVKDDRFVVEIANDTRIELGKSFVSSKIEATIVE